MKRFLFASIGSIICTILTFIILLCIASLVYAAEPSAGTVIQGGVLPPALICPTKEQLCAGELPENKPHDPPPDLLYSLTVRYCDKPVLVWAALKSTPPPGSKIPVNVVQFNAENTPPKSQFPTPKDFTDWLDASPSQTYDLPCVPASATKPIDPDSVDPGSHMSPPSVH